MPNVRNTFTHQIESRTASTAKDSRCVNGYFEQRDQRTKEFIKRPGLVQLTTTPTIGTAQGMFRFAGKLYGVTNNSLWSMTTALVMILESMEAVVSLGSMIPILRKALTIIWSRFNVYDVLIVSIYNVCSSFLSSN